MQGECTIDACADTGTLGSPRPGGAAVCAGCIAVPVRERRNLAAVDVAGSQAGQLPAGGTGAPARCPGGSACLPDETGDACHGGPSSRDDAPPKDPTDQRPTLELGAGGVLGYLVLRCIAIAMPRGFPILAPPVNPQPHLDGHQPRPLWALRTRSTSGARGTAPRRPRLSGLAAGAGHGRPGRSCAGGWEAGSPHRSWWSCMGGHRLVPADRDDRGPGDPWAWTLHRGDAAFGRYLHEATDYAGGRLVPAEF